MNYHTVSYTDFSDEAMQGRVDTVIAKASVNEDDYEMLMQFLDICVLMPQYDDCY